MCLTMALAMMAQRVISGKVIETDSKEPLASTTVKLMKTDSSLVAGVLTQLDGSFKVKAPAAGKYILKISCVGFKNIVRTLNITGDKDIALGNISMETDAIMLQGATITKQAAKVILKEDTFVYNAAAYRTPEGSVVEELVRRLPGAQIDDAGKITINGKEVKKILVDGKEFMTGDTKTAIKNLPTSIVERVKAYDEKSDLARVSGIDDGEEQTVLDFGIKRGMNKGFFTNNDVAYGTEDRYAARLMAAKFNSKLRIMAMGNANNVNDQGFGGGGGRFGRGRSGLNATKMAGLNFNFEEKGKLKLDGSVRWDHSDGDQRTKSSTENFVTTNGSFTNSLNQSFSRSNSWNANMRIEWTPDTMTNISFRPSFSTSSSDGLSSSLSATFNEDPYLYTTNPLSEDTYDMMSARGAMVNSRENSSLSYSNSKDVSGVLQVNRKLNSMGRNITLRLNARYSDSDKKNLSTNNVHLYQKKNIYGLDSTYQTNRYNVTPSKNYSYSAKLTYSEPIMKATFLQLSYEFQYKYTKSDRSTYNFSNLGEDFFDGVTPHYRGWDDYIAALQNPIEDYYDRELSRFSQYKNYIHDIQLMLRIIRKAYNFSAGIKVEPQETEFTYRYQNIDTVARRSVVNITPTLDFKWKIGKQHQLRVNYRGVTSQPSMTNLLPITDDSNPLNITMGNPGLKPSFTNSLWMNYKNYIQRHQRFISAYLSYRTTRNSISNKVTYIEETGGRITKPENINGDWSASANFIFSTALDTTGYFNINSTSEVRYANNVGYLTLDKTSSSVKNATKDLQIYERLAFSYRNDWLELEPGGSLRYSVAKNDLMPNSNQEIWQFSYGMNANVQMPWGMTLATDLNMNSRRGYTDASANTNELIWNVQLSQSLLKGKPLTFTLQFYDILREQSNLSRSISAMQRSDTEYNSITSYVMLHVIYKFNLFGSKDARREMKRGEREAFGNNGPGGFGGSRPRNGGFGGGRNRF